MLLIAFIVLGIITGYVIHRLSTGRYVTAAERRSVRAIGWTLMTLWLSVSGFLFVALAWSVLSGTTSARAGTEAAPSKDGT